MLLDSIKGLGRTFVEILGSRLETLSLDVKEDEARLLSLLALGAVAMFSVFLAVILGLFWLVLAFGEEGRALAAAILAGAFTLLGAVLLLVLARRIRKAPGPFAGTLSELAKDRDALAGVGRRAG